MTILPPYRCGSVLIIGSGLAGLSTALTLAHLDPTRAVTLVTQGTTGALASSAWAQGGIAAAMGEGDTPARHLADTMKAGAGIVSEDAARLVTNAIPGRIEDLAELGVPFDRDENGNFVQGREAAHSAKRIVKVTGDRAGAAVTGTLAQRVLETPGIQILEEHTVIDLLTTEGRVHGVLAVCKNGQPIPLQADHVVLATGGAAGLYAVSTTPLGLMGTGLGLAARAGADIADAEFVQFHPTAMMLGRDPAPLATEALRGEGAVLVTHNGERFMRAIHPDAELAPRDVVARGVHAQILKGKQVFLDCREAVGAAFPDEFPTVYAMCRNAGIDPIVEPIPVAPAAHYHMGGIETDLDGRSSLTGLWACGEVASTGLHGANRLASNSLAEALVMGDRVAKAIHQTADEPDRIRHCAAHLPVIAPSPEAVLQLRQAMTRRVGLIRSHDSLTQAARLLLDMEEDCISLGLANSLAAAMCVTASASLREESRGGHFRSDYPAPREELRRRSRITLTQARAHLSALAETAVHERA